MQLIDILISAALALMMFGIGASLKPADFTYIFRNPKPLLTGLGLQILFLPLLAFLVAICSDMPPAFKAGLFIMSLCPGGTTSNFISYIVKADVALSIAMTSINSLIILITIPIFTNLGLNYFLGNTSELEISLAATFVPVLFVILIPALLGILFNEKFKELSDKLSTPLRYINSVLLASVFAVKFFAGQDSGGTGIDKNDILQILPWVLLLHFGAMFISYFLARRSKLNNLQSTTIGIEVGVKNTTLALLITGTLLNSVDMSKPALVAALFTFFTTLGFAYLMMRKSKAQ